MNDVVQFSKRGNIGIITIDSPPVNALGHAVRQGIADGLASATADDEVNAVVLHCAGRTFIAGADISEFGKPFKEPGLDVVMNGFEQSAKPIIAAIHGTALGGGLETAMACHYRCAVASAKCGQPEVNLGLVPGAGGTQRLPRLVGLEMGAEMNAGGAPISATVAKEHGLIDEIIEGDLLDGAVAYAERLVSEGAPLRRVREIEYPKDIPADLFDNLRKKYAKIRRGFEAPQRNIDLVEASTKLPFDEGMAKEQEVFFECMMSVQSAAQRHLFFAERQANKIPDVPKDTPTKDIKSVMVLGAGTMGGGIAMNFANAGISVKILDTTQELVDKGMAIVEKNYANTVKKGRLSQEKMDQRMSLITPTANFDDVGSVDMVIEAVFEEMDIKKDVFGKLDKLCRPDAIMATNTSTLDVDEIAAVTSRPEQVIGTHFFSPANVMRLLEIVRGAKTSKEVIATTFKIAKQIRKVGVLSGVCDGFIGNRMIHGYSREAMFLVEEGALPQQVDAALYNFGMAMGPLAMGDLAGLDVSWRIRKRQEATRNKDLRYSAIADKVCEMDRYGQKTGGGWYDYKPGDRTPYPNPEIEKLILEESNAAGITRREISDEEIIERTIYALVNEGAKILEEGIALRASDIDVIYISGYGFPIHRGGPMFYADCTGLANVYKRVCEFHEEHGDFWKPAPLLKQLAEEGKTFNKLG